MLEQYTLYIRCRDKACSLVERESGSPVEIAEVLPASVSSGLFILPRGRTGIHLYRDEIKLVDEFPAVVIE